MQALMKNKRGQQLGGIMSLVLTLGAAGIALAVVLLVLASVLTNAQVAANGNATAAVQQTIVAISQVPAWFGIIVIAVVGAVVLGIVVGAFMYFRGRE
jgi:hypothetical protein